MSQHAQEYAQLPRRAVPRRQPQNASLDVLASAAAENLKLLRTQERSCALLFPSLSLMSRPTTLGRLAAGAPAPDFLPVLMP
jgi:hypothetical protein